ncbi:MAG: NADH-quinone oxidoreductase subunit A [Phycisphaerales bacterium]
MHGLALPTAPLLVAQADLQSYLPIFIIIVMAITFGAANLVLTSILGPSRRGRVKGMAYESGMNPVGTARKRFNVRFYLIAVVFLVFDVEIIFLYPWAATFTNLAPGSENSAVWLARIMFFLFTTVVAYLYGWRKGVFRFD